MIRQVQKIGNGAHVYIPKELIGQKVVVRTVKKSLNEIKREIIDILEPYLEHIKGIYLYGSYARNEQKLGSDIDILVITDREIKMEDKIKEYEIVSATLEQIEKTLKDNIISILPIIKECKPIINKGLLDLYKKINLTKKNIRWYIKSTKNSLIIIKDLLKDKLKSSIPNITYILMMRLRGLLLINCLKRNTNYTNKLLKIYLKKKGLKKEEIEELYKVYRVIRDEKKVCSYNIGYDLLEKVYEITLNELNKYD